MFHEEHSALTPHTRDLKRAIDSLREEFEAIDWYQQRADACTNEELKAILLHNRAEEYEHASMLLEWIRRNDERAAHEFKDYLFKDGAIGHST